LVTFPSNSLSKFLSTYLFILKKGAKFFLVLVFYTVSPEAPSSSTLLEIKLSPPIYVESRKKSFQERVKLFFFVKNKNNII